jgi:hypothetical protein
LVKLCRGTAPALQDRLSFGEWWNKNLKQGVMGMAGQDELNAVCDKKLVERSPGAPVDRKYQAAVMPGVMHH